MIGSTREVEVAPGLTTLVFRQNSNFSRITFDALADNDIVFETIDDAIQKLPELQGQIESAQRAMEQEMADAKKTIESQEEFDSFLQTYGFDPFATPESAYPDPMEIILRRIQETFAQIIDSPQLRGAIVGFANPAYFVAGGRGTACPKSVLLTCWDRRGAGDNAGDHYFCRINAQGGVANGYLVRSFAAPVKRAIMITQRSEKALKDTKFMWASVPEMQDDKGKIQDSKKYSLVHRLLILEASSDQPFETKVIPTIEAVLPSGGQPLDERGERDGWVTWGWEWEEGWSWNNALEVELTKVMKNMIGNVQANFPM